VSTVSIIEDRPICQLFDNKSCCDRMIKINTVCRVGHRKSARVASKSIAKSYKDRQKIEFKLMITKSCYRKVPLTRLASQDGLSRVTIRIGLKSKSI
jgi:hypothetical protein